MNNPLICVKNDFFEDPGEVQTLLGACTFADFRLGVDGVLYPHICRDLPSALKFEFLYKLETVLGAKILPYYLFARAMPEGVAAPSKVHSDRDMGKFTAHVYISPESRRASTSFLCHRSLGYAPLPEHNGSEWSQDPLEWDRYLTVLGAPNRLLVHHAAHFHCAEPEKGFGTLGKDARLVVTCFFDLL
jgi:hypothetical protein